MRMWAVLIGLAVGGVLLWGDAAHAFGVRVEEGTVVRWADPVVYVELNRDGAPDIDDGSELVAIRDAMRAWSGVACSRLTLVESRETKKAKSLLSNGGDSVNRIVWDTRGDWPLGGLVVAATLTLLDENQNILEADVVFNGNGVPWNNNGGFLDVRTVATHELGHFIGLKHVLAGDGLPLPPNMSNVDTPRRAAFLTADDASGVCFLYPLDAYTCDEDCDCPGVVAQDAEGREYNAERLTCVGGSCGDPFEPTGGRVIGDPCTSSSQCESPLTCETTDGLGAYCTTSCITGADCPGGFQCSPFVGANGACVSVLLDFLGPPPGAYACQADVARGFQGDGSCFCDVSPDCDADCDCDALCARTNRCACDVDPACDADCECDYTCRSPAGCTQGSGGAWPLLLVLASLPRKRESRETLG